MKSFVIAGTVALALASPSAFARPGGQTNTSTAKSSGSPDLNFVTEAAQGGMAEVELGRLAADKASSDEVKRFAGRMVNDHSRANDELKSIAESKHLSIPTGLDSKDQALHDRLSKLSGAAFDRAYMNAMVRDHRMDVAAFRRESQSGRDPEVKAWAAKTLPTLEDHLKEAQQADKTAVATSGTRSRTASPTGSSGKTR